MALTDRQRLFVECYCQCGFNATEAAKRAGYSPDRAMQEGYELRRHPQIAAAIEERLKAEAMSANEVLGALTEIARGDYSRYIEVYGNGQLVRFDLEKAEAEGKLHLVREWKTTLGGYRLKFHDRLKALELLAKAQGLLKERVEQSGEVTVRVVRDAGNPAPSAGVTPGAAEGPSGSETV